MRKVDKHDLFKRTCFFGKNGVNYVLAGIVDRSYDGYSFYDVFCAFDKGAKEKPSGNASKSNHKDK